ncbi:hypothetical protein ALC57_01207, partial [Trachymyrmex cornetzi]
KRDIMGNKYKFKGEQVYVENDLSWEERKIQEQINRWAKERRGKGEDIEIARGKVRIEGKWIYWEELERIMAREREDKKSQGGGREEREGLIKGKSSGGNWKLIFWNVAGIETKDRDFWRFLEGYDYIGLCETWLTEERWHRLKTRLPESHE